MGVPLASGPRGEVSVSGSPWARSATMTQRVLPPADPLHLVLAMAKRLRRSVTAFRVQRVEGRRLISTDPDQIDAPILDSVLVSPIGIDSTGQIVEATRQHLMVARSVRQIPHHVESPYDHRHQHQTDGPCRAQANRLSQGRDGGAAGYEHGDHHPTVPRIKERTARRVVAGAPFAIMQEVVSFLLPIDHFFSGFGNGFSGGVGGGTSLGGMFRIGGGFSGGFGWFAHICFLISLSAVVQGERGAVVAAAAPQRFAIVSSMQAAA